MLGQIQADDSHLIKGEGEGHANNSMIVPQHQSPFMALAKKSRRKANSVMNMWREAKFHSLIDNYSLSFGPKPQQPDPKKTKIIPGFSQKKQAASNNSPMRRAVQNSQHGVKTSSLDSSRASAKPQSSSGKARREQGVAV